MSKNFHQGQKNTVLNLIRDILIGGEAHIPPPPLFDSSGAYAPYALRPDTPLIIKINDE